VGVGAGVPPKPHARATPGRQAVRSRLSRLGPKLVTADRDKPGHTQEDCRAHSLLPRHARADARQGASAPFRSPRSPPGYTFRQIFRIESVT
jgi:hypothetical protein